MSNDYPAAPSTTNNYSPQVHAQPNGSEQSMDGRQAEYPQPDQTPAAQYSQGQDAKFNPTATPSGSEYGMTPQSGRHHQYPDYAQRPPYSDQRYPAPPDPNISASSPTYPPQPPHYAHYPPHEMGHYQPMYAPRPGEYPPPAYGHPYAGHYGPPMMGRGGPPGGGVPLSTVYSFVPIPGTHQQKRPRRRYEEIERMYKCGWNGCEKAYGTLNHLNAHVTMQAHGVKRTPEEFKEIRKEWKQRKKEDDQNRKDDDQHPGQGRTPDGQPGGDNGQAAAGYSQAGAPRTLPPLGYAPAGGQPVQPQSYAQPVEGSMPQYSGQHVQGYYQQGPGSPYAGQQQQMYSQPPPSAPATGQEEPVAEST